MQLKKTDRKMRTQNMKRLFAIGAFAAAAAFAQTTGHITVNGDIPGGFSLTNTSNATLTATVSLATLTPANISTLVGGTTDVRLRSNKPYKLTASTALTTTGVADADGGGDHITAADIGFGINATVGTGANVVTRSDTVTDLFDYLTTNVNALTVTNGLTPYVVATPHKGTLADISGGAQVIAGNRISKKGNILTDNNFLLLTFGVATLPQYFTATTGFQADILLTIASN
jgi:hypothetical protein